MIVVTMPCCQVKKLGQQVQQIIEICYILFSFKTFFDKQRRYFRSYHNDLVRNWRRQEIFIERI